MADGDQPLEEKAQPAQPAPGGQSPQQEEELERGLQSLGITEDDLK